MASTQNVAKHATDAAKKMLDERIAVVTELGQAQAKEDTAADALEQARSDRRATWQKALSAGWTEANLTDMGLSKPSGGRRKRPADTAQTTGQPSSMTTADTSPSAM